MELSGIPEQVTLQTLRNRRADPAQKLGGTCYYNSEKIDVYLTNSKSVSHNCQAAT